MVDTHQPRSAREHERLVRMGLYAVVGFALVMVLTVLVVFAHRPHTPELVPGKPPSPIAWLDFSQPS